MRIGIDVDGVLANFAQGYADLIRKISGRDLLSPEIIAAPPTWNWDRDAGYTKEEETATWNVINNSPNFWATLSAFGKNLDAVANIGLEHDVYFITTRTGIMPKVQTEEFLLTELPYFPTVLISSNKAPIAVGLELDVFIDDRDKNILEVAQASPKTQCFILDYPYNKNVEETSNIHRVYSVEQALEEAGVVEYNSN